MLARDSSNNMFHVILFESFQKRSKTYHTLCGKSFLHVPNTRLVADEYTRCPECKAIVLARTGRPVVKRLKDKSESSELQIGKSGELA